MAFDHRLQCLGEVVETFAALGPEQRPQYIRVPLPGRQVMIENPFLQRRQRIDVLHIASPARYRIDDSVNRLLAQIGQRQHVRGNAKRRTEPVTAHSSYQRQQFCLVHAQAFKSGTVQPLVVSENHQIIFFLLKTDRVRGKNCHQFAEVHRITCCFSFRRGLTTPGHGVANSVSHDKYGGASKLEDRTGSGRRYDWSRSNKGLRSYDTHETSHSPCFPHAAKIRASTGDCLSWEAGTRLEGDVNAAMCERLAEQAGGMLGKRWESVAKGFRVDGNHSTVCKPVGWLPWLQIRRLRLNVGIFVSGTSSRLTLPTEAAT
ncbi:hypothetical protein ALQ15_05715 [Pseudomonas syringae pv. actinidiae]|uniref:Uncharacterized protein n=1 Tax=Pseudomonas syringae pv. actinidiae TaxID=103796 RepID=A0A7Z6XWL0_PSESF|nr:hypothetical protein ALQ15_05715 [Pseudomonas syringae pv. actinidiae]